MISWQLATVLMLFGLLGAIQPLLAFWFGRLKRSAEKEPVGSPPLQTAAARGEARSESKLDAEIQLQSQMVLCAYLVVLLLLGWLYARSAPPPYQGSKSDIVSFTVLQLNDVYEIEGVNQGKEGGLARVATLRKKLLNENPNVITILAGDVLSPSVMGTARYDGDRIKGRQMIDVLNALHLDYATFGNHEFDLDEKDLLSRLQESSTEWISTNVSTCEADAPFETPDSSGGKKVVKGHSFKLFSNAEGRAISLGLIGLTINSNPKDYVYYHPPASAAISELQKMSGADLVIAVTHLNIGQDRCLAGKFSARPDIPKVALILGGHEHENHIELAGADSIPITKADSNARTVYVHRIVYDTKDRRVLSLTSELVKITDVMEADSAVDKIVQKWMKVMEDGFAGSGGGFKIHDRVAILPASLDGREAEVRTKPTNLTIRIGESLAKSGSTQYAIYNAGSIRLDGIIPAGELTEYDVLKILPYEGQVRTATIRGSDLQALLDSKEAPPGNGMFLQLYGIDRNKIDSNAPYTVASTSFMFRCEGDKYPGGGIHLDHVKELHGQAGDVRHVLINEFKNNIAPYKTDKWIDKKLCSLAPLSSGESACSRKPTIKPDTAAECLPDPAN